MINQLYINLKDFFFIIRFRNMFYAIYKFMINQLMFFYYVNRHNYYKNLNYRNNRVGLNVDSLERAETSILLRGSF